MSSAALAHLVGALAWPLIGIVSTAGRAAIRAGAGLDPDPRGMQLGIISWSAWGLLAQVIVLLARRWQPLVSVRNFSIHAIGLIATSSTHSAMYLSLFTLLFRPEPPLTANEIWQVLPTFLGIDLLVYITTVSAVVAVERYAQGRSSEAEEELLREQLVHAELSVLERRIRPRFLLRALGALERLIESDRAKADELIARLSHFLRASLRDEPSDVGSELALLDDFLAIESLSSGREVLFETDVDAAIISSEVPPLFVTQFVDAAWPDDGVPTAVRIRGAEDHSLTISINGPHRPAREVESLLPIREGEPTRLTEAAAAITLQMQLAATEVAS